jgi:hypothetical protein
MSNKKIILMNDFRRPGNYPNGNLSIIKERLNGYKIESIIEASPSLELHLFSWVNVQESNFPIPSKITLKLLNSDGVIGLELPRNIIHFLKKNGIPYINYHYSCYRCVDQELWALETCMHLDKNLYVPKVSRPFLNEHKIGTLLVGQTKYDRVLIKNKKFLSLMDYEDILETLPQPIYFSPHPLGGDELRDWASKKSYIMTNLHTYELFDNRPNLVCGVNSSTLYEARDIWKLNVKFLSKLPEAKNYIHLPREMAFDHYLINTIFNYESVNANKFIHNLKS